MDTIIIIKPQPNDLYLDFEGRKVAHKISNNVAYVMGYKSKDQLMWYDPVEKDKISDIEKLVYKLSGKKEVRFVFCQ